MLSRIAYFLCAALLLYCAFIFYPRWEKKGGEATISWDASGYYWYLPSIFIYHDLAHQSFKDSILDKYSPTPPGDFQQGLKQPNGNYVMKYSSGVALMETPFFLAGHLAATTLGYPADGFSPPYQLAIQLGGVLIALLGLWYFRKFLLLFYSDGIVAITLLLLVFGSNYLNYAAIDAGMSHSWLFTVYVFLLLNTYYFYKTPRTRYAIRIGLLTGLAVLIRPTDIISCFIPLLWGLETFSIKAIKEKLAFFRQQYGKLIIAVIAAALVILTQPIYWKTISGHWLVYSYGDQSFSWRHPHVYRYAFDAWNGWLAYTPLMILAFIGVLPYLKYGHNKVLVIVFFMACYYIVSAWDVWWYGGRAMVQYYPVLFMLIASLLQWLSAHKIWQWSLSAFILLFTYINTWWTYQAHGGKFYDGSQVSSAYYWHTIGRFAAPADIDKLKDTDEWFDGKENNMELLAGNTFEEDSVYYKSPLVISGRGSLYLNEQQKEYMQSFPWPDRNHRWLRVLADFHCVTKEWDVWHMATLLVQFKNGEQVVKERFIRLHRFLGDNETKKIFLDIKVPAIPFDTVKIVINNNSDKELAVDNLELWSFN